jgi:threonine dehydratase
MITETIDAAKGADEVTLATIRAARERIQDAIYRSPCVYSLSLSRLCGCDVYCKLEHLQMTGSFKERGARNKLLALSESERKTGVIAASAGNHALALAYHGQLLGIPVTVVMPKWAPLVKVVNCRSFGAEIILHGESYADAKEHALAQARGRNLAYVPGFDDPAIISGAGTIGLEVLEEVPDCDVVIVPVGGGGLIAGVGVAVKSLNPDVRVIGVEPANAPTMDVSLKTGAVTKIPTKPTLADGLAVAECGKLCFEIARNVIDEMLLVDEPQIAQAALRLLELEKTVVEGGGAVTLAAAMNPAFDLAGKKVVLILTGGNIDVTVISKIIERGLAADGRLCRITAHVSDRPGSLAHLTSILASAGASVKEVYHDRQFAPGDVGMVNIVCILETRDAQHVREIQDALKAAGIRSELR